jgi:hypothetical protein
LKNNIQKSRLVKFPSSATMATVGDSEKIQFYGNKLWTNFRYKFWRNAKESQNKDKVNKARADREKIIEIMKRAVRRTIPCHEQAVIILPIEKGNLPNKNEDDIIRRETKTQRK